MATIKVFGAVFNSNGEILLVHRRDGDQNWTTPGGKLRPGEQPENGLKRIILEELGVEAEVHGMIGVYSAVFKDHIFIFLESGLADAEKLAEWKPNEHISEIGFFNEDNLPKPMYERTIIRLHDAFEAEHGVMRALDNT